MLVKTEMLDYESGEALVSINDNSIWITEDDSITKFYVVRKMCYDASVPYEDTITAPTLFDNKEDAIEFAYKLANEEVDELMEDFKEGDLISYGVVDSECSRNGNVLVNIYELESEDDTTGYTELLTEYIIEDLTLASNK